MILRVTLKRIKKVNNAPQKGQLETPRKKKCKKVHSQYVRQIKILDKF